MDYCKQIFLLCIVLLASSRNISARQDSLRHNRYAVVVGISSYQNPALPSLQYADKDATLFAAHLRSETGSHVPAENIRLLLNEQATIAAIYDALNWLQEHCSKDDKAYFYFSGHGDVETQHAFSLGYLLAYNSPPNNYRNNAVRIEDLNKVANQLSTKSNATVVLVTDACHTGQLAGDYYKGRQFVASQLKLILNNEVRLAACGVDEKAAEGSDWGGGRGVFSYYLLKGLNGLADLDQNDTIQLRELESYLASAFASDKALIRNAHRQHPSLDGNPYQTMGLTTTSSRDSASFAMAESGTMHFPSALQEFKPLGRQPIDYFFGLMKSSAIDSRLRFATYQKTVKDSLPLQLIDDCITLQKRLDRKKDSLAFLNIETAADLAFANIDTLLLLKTSLLKSKALVNKFNERFIQTVHAAAQDMVNAYLEGDLAELEKRQYYYSGNRQYAGFIQMHELALRLTPEQHYLRPLLAVQHAYIAGLNARLEMVTSQNTPALLTRAFRYQREALKLEPYAAYIYNEIGNLYLREKKYALAERNFHMASEFSPTWSVPWNNRIRLNLATGNLKKATFAAITADSLQSNLPYTFMNAGLVMLKQGNLLDAESYFQKAIAGNNIHFFPYEKLGELYIRTGDFRKADWYLAAAQTRKQAFAINDKSFTYGIELGGAPPAYVSAAGYCDLSRENQPVALAPYIRLSSALQAIQSHPDSALDSLKMLSGAVTGAVHLPYHYAGKIGYIKQNWQEAAANLQQAIQHYQPDSVFHTFLYSELKEKHGADSCLLVNLEHYQYDVLEDHYLLAGIHEKLGEKAQAIEAYARIMDIENNRQRDQATFRGFNVPQEISSERFRLMHAQGTFGNPDELLSRYETPIPMGGYMKLASLYEKSGDYAMAEKVHLEQVRMNREAGDSRRAETKRGPFQLAGEIDINFYWLAINRNAEAQTRAFYERVLRLFPRDTEWQKKRGMFLYDRLALAFGQVPVGHYKSVYQNIKHFAYPFASADETGDEEEIRFTLPGTEEPVRIPTPRYDPLEEALMSLEMSQRLSGDLQPDPHTMEAIADLHSWMGNDRKAFQIYRQLVQGREPERLLRDKVIDYSFAVHEAGFAMDQLEILDKKHQLNPGQRIRLAECYALKGNTQQAIHTLTTYNDLSNRPSAMLLAKINWLARRHAKALSYLHAPASQGTSNEDAIDAMHAKIDRYYAIARLYALLKQHTKALAALKKAFQAGFDLRYVLNNDPAWQTLRVTVAWKRLQKQFAPQLQAVDYTSNPTDWNSALDYRIPH